jgi:hypothetical protein
MPDDRDVSRHDETSTIPDLHDLPLEELFRMDDSPLDIAMRRRLHDLKNPNPPLAAHNTTT